MPHMNDFDDYPPFFCPKIGVNAWILKFFLINEDKILETTLCQVFTTIK